jgi:eukaryotic-like serine/threonine-protein kinase
MSGEEWQPPETFEEYRLVEPLGSGAMGQVYLAHDSLLDRSVAVKFPRTGTDRETRERFFSEARAIARLQHPNVVAVYRVAEVAGHPYLVSEYVRGKSLDQIERPVAWRKAHSIAIALARGLAAAHARSVLHRDVKPANAIITEDGHAKLLDFGLATIVDGTQIETAVVPSRRRTSERPACHLAAIDATASSYQRESLSFGNGTPKHGPAGTPLYTAPELWRGEPATPRSDLYSLGILIYELVAGVAPHRGIPMAELGDVIQNRDVPRLGNVVAGVDPAFAAIVDRLIDRDAAARFPSADALLAALEDSVTSKLDAPDGNPYRGLAAFDSAQGSLFFGRRTEIRELVDRVRSDGLVIVGGDSGTGKSSLCRAGVLAWLVDHDGWGRVDVMPGRHPVRALAAALAQHTDIPETELEARMREAPDDVARAIRRSGVGEQPQRLIVFVDQLEEILTLGEPADARAFAETLAALASRSSVFRVLATARSDYLSRLAKLPGLGEELGRGLYFLRPLTGEAIREAIVRPVAVKGVRFESDALVDALVEQTESAPGGLPLLQFTLAELWDARDVETQMIRADALTALGGVAGALSRHADRIVAGLDAAGREAARKLLLRLVTAERTRARRSEAELFVDGSERAALEALVRGRIVVGSDVQEGAYEIAHEALVTSWSTLQHWLDETAVEHVVLRRLEQAAGEWERSNFDRDLLWSSRRLAETKVLARESLGRREAAFIGAARQRIVRMRLGIAAGLAVLLLGTVSVGVVLRARARRHLEEAVAEQLTKADTAIAAARKLAHDGDVARTRAYRLFDAHQWTAGEDAWNEVERLGADEAAKYRAASSSFEAALSLDPTSTQLREQRADLLLERLVRARRNRSADLADELAGRLAAYDNGRRMTLLDVPAHIALDVPAGTRIWRERAGVRVPVGTSFDVPPGELVLELDAVGHTSTRLPILAAPGESLRLSVALPAAAAVPASMIYVPSGRFLFGSGDSSDVRRGFLNSPPIHEVTTPAYLIARHEVTFGEWIEFLDSLPPAERKQRTPSSITPQSSIMLTELAPKRWRFTLVRATRTYEAEVGERIHYERRDRRADQDWLKMPVSAVSFEDAVAYATWLDRTNRVPHARLCDEDEWERAMRGADGRTFPTGEVLAPDDANIDVTYGREPLAFGPDEVGSHPRSRSPVGADDMAGNVWEWTRSVETVDMPIARGGGWYNEALSARSTNREPGEPTQRHIWIGIRICADAPSTR